jgi:hypothetical protein
LVGFGGGGGGGGMEEVDIELSVLRFTTSDYPCDIFNLAMISC